MEPRETVPIVMMDNGSYRLRAGYPGEEGPRVCIPSLVGQPRNRGVAMASGMHEYEVGFEAEEQRGLLFCNQPIRAGRVTNWEDVERLWSHVIFKQLRIIPEDFCFVLTQPANNSEEQKEATLELMMETFNAHSVYLGAAPVFSLYCYGRTTGVVVDCGLDSTAAIPVHEGYPLGRHVCSSPVAGQMITDYLCELMKQKGYGFDTLLEKDLVNSVKETLCYVRTPDDLDKPTLEHFYLPDGQPIPVDHQRTDCPEALFDFSVLGSEHIPAYKIVTDAGVEYTPSIPKGVSWLTYASINNCEPSLRPTLFDNIVLAGGTSLFKGAQQRMLHEVTSFYKDMHPNEGLIPISIAESSCMQFSAWLGGCMLSTISMFPHLTVNRKEYQENGKRIIHCKSL